MFFGKKMHIEDISELCSISKCSIRCYIDRFKQTGEVKPTAYKHGPPKLLGNYELVLLRIILENPGIYLHEIQFKLSAVFGQTVSISTICQALHHMGCTQQTMQHIAIQRSDEQSHIYG